MDACARIKGVPVKNRATIRKENVRENSALSLRSLLKNRRELSNVVPELHTRESQYLPEVRVNQIHYVCLPSHAEGEDFTLQAFTSLSAELMELLRSLHVHTLKDEEVLLLKDPIRHFERKEGISQANLSRAMCILRYGGSPQISTILGLLTRYTAGIRYALELQSLQRGLSEACQAEDDDTNQSVSSIEEDFVTAFEHLEEEETASYSKRNQRDVASQTLPPHFKDVSGSRILVSSISKKSMNKEKSTLSETIQKASTSWSGCAESQWSLTTPSSPPKGHFTTTSLTESDESDCSSPSPIIFLDEVGYQKSLKAKLDIPKIPVLKEGVEDSDSEVSEFFDSFDQFDDLDQIINSSMKMPKEQALFSQKMKPSESSVSKYASKGGSTTAMNPQKFDHRLLPANVKKPTPLKPGSPYSIQSDAPDSPRPSRTSCEENGGLFSPVRSSAFSPLGEGAALECFWKADGDSSELRKPQDLCSLYKTYSDFANSLSKEILGTVCGYSSPIDININKNLSCVCHKEFKNSNGHLMKLSDIQETVTIAKSQSQSLKDGIQKFATDLVEMSIGSALRDLQKGVSSCTTTLCHLAARLTSSVFQMAFQEIGIRHAYVLKERAINGLASFLVGEAVSGALKEFLFVKKQIFNNTVTRFASDLAEELIFESIMEVCQFSHPSTPLTSKDWSFEQEEEVVCSYASDLSESVLQEAFIELSQADVAFTTQAAISVSLDNICYVSAEDTSQTVKICNARVSCQEPMPLAQTGSQEEDGCTVKKALYCVSGMASCVPVPAAGKAISYLQNPEETCHYKSSISHTCQTSPKRSICSQGRAVTSTSDTAMSSESRPGISRVRNACGNFGNISSGASSGKTPAGKTFHNFSGAMVDTIVGEAFDIMTTSKMKKKVEDCADFLSKTIGSRVATSGSGLTKSQDVACQSSAPYDLRLPQKIVSLCPKGGMAESSFFCHTQSHLNLGSKNTVNSESVSRNIRPASKFTPDVQSAMLKDTLEVPSFEVTVRGNRKVLTEEILSTNSGAKSTGTPGTPPSTPQQPSDISREKQIKQFSKKLKGKLAKEFSPATPPPTPHYQLTTGHKDDHSDSDKAEFMLKLMRSLSEEAVNNEDEDDEQEDGTNSAEHHAELTPTVGYRINERGALCYAERLACHIVSMATEMDTISFGGGVRKQDNEDGKGSVALHSAQFSERTLNSLWTYAGEIAGEVINDVKRMVISNHCHHKTTKTGSSIADSRQSGDQKHSRLTNMTNQWSNDLLAPILNPQRGSSSGMSEYPSCESVTDEYAGYVIKVLKKEGGSRELILDQYASRLAYKSIKSGLAHAARKIKQRSPLKLHSSRRLHHEGNHNVCSIVSSESYPSFLSQGKDSSSSESMFCVCQDGEDINKNEYMELLNFAESLAYNITCDVTRKLRTSSARLPKSLTDSCLYRKSNVDDVAENLIKTTFSCSMLPYTEKNRQYHSTGSLDDGNYNNGVMQVIEHYAKKIVDDTLEVTIGHASHQTAEERRTLERNSFTEKLTEAYMACRYCKTRDCLFCRRDGPLKYQGLQKRMRQDSEGMAGLEIPKIHIDLEKRAEFAEEMVSVAIEKARKELSSTSLNADSGIGHDGASFAESLTTEIMTSALSNVCQATNLSAPGRESVNVTESTVSQQLNLSVGDDSLGSWSNLSFEEDHPDESSSFHHLSESNGNSSSWSSLGLEGEVYEEHLSFSPSDSDYTEEKEAEAKNELGGTVRVEKGQAQVDRALLVVSTDVWGQAPDPQLRVVLQWMAASIAELSVMQFTQQSEQDLQQFLAIVQRLREREWRVGELLQALLRYYEECPTEEESGAVDMRHGQRSLFQWLLEHS
ncbi:A-kinase anchor protein 11 isoform X2 [Hoplias malabaricus]|uniref:A-kinase anchor protein 11 isoform X2 n=1 Tax=Hoplias malabaricus TaxID=27720 RepID=UPI0034627B32